MIVHVKLTLDIYLMIVHVKLTLDIYLMTVHVKLQEAHTHSSLTE